MLLAPLVTPFTIYSIHSSLTSPKSRYAKLTCTRAKSKTKPVGLTERDRKVEFGEFIKHLFNDGCIDVNVQRATTALPKGIVQLNAHFLRPIFRRSPFFAAIAHTYGFFFKDVDIAQYFYNQWKRLKRFRTDTHYADMVNEGIIVNNEWAHNKDCWVEKGVPRIGTRRLQSSKS